MAYVPVPKDLTKVKTKVAFNLTKRQLVCFGGGALIGVPLFFLLRGPVGNSVAAMCMMLVMVNNLDSTKIGVLGTLFGALIGGTMSLFGSVWVNSKQQKAKKYIMRKNLIYSPLYDELVKRKEEAFSEQKYPTDVKFVKDEQRLIGLLEFSVWERIKLDRRYLEVPNELIQQMKLFQETVEQYLSALEDTALEVETIIKEVFEENGKPVQTFDRLAKRVASIIMSENNENLYNEICHGKEDTETSKKIDAEIRKKVKENPKAKKLEEAYNSWESVHEQTIEFLGLMIQQVLTKYEE